jgi:hypothetical protein
MLPPSLSSPKLSSSISNPLSSIAERRVGSGDDSEDEDEEEDEGGWKAADVKGKMRGNAEEIVIKAGYLWKKGERRKVCHTTNLSGNPLMTICYSTFVTTDMEKAVVCLATCSFSVLQDIS